MQILQVLGGSKEFVFHVGGSSLFIDVSLFPNVFFKFPVTLSTKVQCYVKESVHHQTSVMPSCSGTNFTMDSLTYLPTELINDF